MFSVFCGTLLFSILLAAMEASSPRGRSRPYGVIEMFQNFIGFIAGACAIFAAVYLPVRWKTVMKLPRTVKTLGLIGGFGLIALVLLGVLLVLVDT